MDILYDEENTINSEEQSRPATGEEDWDGSGKITWCDNHWLRVRLLKETAHIASNRDSGQATFPIYLLIEERYSWIGEDPRLPTTRTKKRAYVTGPDSKRIRQAISLLDEFGGERSYDSK
ncbi:hypothetical protein LCGC14_3080530 [marine sediment metagenome]|uniref:Uncharacterized protein n=1 Tax=marine sediment metagenome TaxID=412755 RepID=A0A0F8Z481_9ZZZZ